MPTSALEKVKTWLAAYPYWEAQMPEVLPKVLEETSRQEDVLGNSVVGCRYHICLFWQMTGQDDEAENARRLLDFQQWVREQSLSGLAPRFGDVPARENIRTEKGGLTLSAQFVTYTVTLIADFMKVYEVN